VIQNSAPFSLARAYDRARHRSAKQICWLQLGDEIASAYRVALFVRRLRRGRGSEFLKARIIPKRIEHWIEPEQRRSERARREIAPVRDRE
jgi:hypothetical protein